MHARGVGAPLLSAIGQQHDETGSDSEHEGSASQYYCSKSITSSLPLYEQLRTCHELRMTVPRWTVAANILSRGIQSTPQEL